MLSVVVGSLAFSQVNERVTPELLRMSDRDAITDLRLMS